MKYTKIICFFCELIMNGIPIIYRFLFLCKNGKFHSTSRLGPAAEGLDFGGIDPAAENKKDGAAAPFFISLRQGDIIPR